MNVVLVTKGVMRIVVLRLLAEGCQNNYVRFDVLLQHDAGSEKRDGSEVVWARWYCASLAAGTKVTVPVAHIVSRMPADV